MELKEFIKTVLVDIVGAVKETQEAVGDTATVMPYGRKQNGINGTVFTAEPSDINFDVAVTTSFQESNSANAKAGINVASVLGIGAGAKHENLNGENQLSRIKFSLKITLPHHHYPKS